MDAKKKTKMSHIRNFMIGPKELEAIEVLKANSINISHYLRFSLINLSSQLQEQKEKRNER